MSQVKEFVENEMSGHEKEITRGLCSLEQCDEKVAKRLSLEISQTRGLQQEFKDHVSIKRSQMEEEPQGQGNTEWCDSNKTLIQSR